MREEVRFALEADHLEGRVLAIQFGDAAADALDWRLGRRQYVDARGDEGNEAVTAAFGKMRASSGSED